MAATQASAGSFPVNRLTGAESGLVEDVAVRVYVYGGHRYCFYFNGWHGPGWYRCGFAFRRGLGWGGVYGWNDWSYGPYERRYHRHGHRDDWHHGRSRSNRVDSDVDIRSRSNRVDSNVNIRSRSTTGGGTPSGARVRGSTRSTTGSGSSIHVQSGGSNRVQGGPTGEGAAGVRGGGGVSTGGGSGAGAVQGPTR